METLKTAAWDSEFGTLVRPWYFVTSGKTRHNSGTRQPTLQKSNADLNNTIRIVYSDDRTPILVSGQGANPDTAPPITLMLDSGSDFHRQLIPEPVTQAVVDNIETVQAQMQYGKTVMLIPR